MASLESEQCSKREVILVALPINTTDPFLGGAMLPCTLTW